MGDDLDDLFSRSLPSSYSDLTSDVISVTASSSVSQTTNDDPDHPPKVPGTSFDAT